MNAPRHTPTPWGLHVDYRNGARLYSLSTNKTIALIPIDTFGNGNGDGDGDGRALSEQAEADAHLLWAAPKLLEIAEAVALALSLCPTPMDKELRDQLVKLEKLLNEALSQAVLP
jgi:hypothetical protein